MESTYPAFFDEDPRTAIVNYAWSRYAVILYTEPKY